MKHANHNKIKFMYLITAIALLASGCAAQNVVSSQTVLPSVSETETEIDIYKPNLFKDGDTAEYHYSFLWDTGLRIDIVFPCKGCEVEIGTSVGYIIAAGKGDSTFNDMDKFKERRYTVGEDYDFVSLYPLEREEDRYFADHAVITFTVYENGKPIARGEIDAVKTSQESISIDYELILTSFELYC